MEKEFYSNGKLLLTGEYVVLDGAMALAIPTRYGQSLRVKTSDKPGIQWTSYDEKEAIWFSDRLSLTDFSPEDISNPISNTLSRILLEARKLNPDFLSENLGLEVSTHLDFPRNWGLGTSSTLINNIAQWAQVDAFKLLERSFGGSGYDIASAQNDNPIFFRKTKGQPEVHSVDLNWNFKEDLFFVHLNQKQDSKEGIAHYRQYGVNETLLQRISEISQQLPTCDSMEAFETLLDEHEDLISQSIQIPTVKKQLFSDYTRSIKSLGAWGGDFILATGGPSERDYFRAKGTHTIISFEEMIKT